MTADVCDVVVSAVVGLSAAGRFVVKRGRDADGTPSAGKSHGADDLVVVDAPGGLAGKEAWRRVLEEREDAAWAQPVLVDDDGQERYPTGEVTLRFGSPPSDDDLQAFVRARRLRVARRNEFQPALVVVVPEHLRDVYLPELCDEFERSPGIARAWPNTTSRYTRT